MQDSSREKIILFDIDYTLFDTETFKKTNLQIYQLYPEIKAVLSQLATVAKLAILSEGEKDFQKTKLQKTDIISFFPEEHIDIVTIKNDNIHRVLKRYEQYRIFLVDDKLDILYRAKRILPSLYAIWVKRGKYAREQKPIKNFAPDAIIADLQQVVSIIASA